MEIRVYEITSPTEEVRALIEALDEELNASYLPEQRHGLNLAAIFQPGIKFFLVRVGGKAAGCGAMAFFGHYAEVKRMYVTPAARRHGIARAILAHIEAEALAAGINCLHLETGDAQTAAMQCYEAAGFSPCGPFGDYLAMTETAIATSRFYEKRL